MDGQSFFSFQLSVKNQNGLSAICVKIKMIYNSKISITSYLNLFVYRINGKWKYLNLFMYRTKSKRKEYYLCHDEDNYLYSQNINDILPECAHASNEIRWKECNLCQDEDNFFYYSKIFMNDLQIYMQILIAIGILISTAKKSLIRKT